MPPRGLNAGLLVPLNCPVTTRVTLGSGRSSLGHFGFGAVSPENRLHLLSLVPRPVAADPRGLSGTARGTGTGRAHLGRPGCSAEAGGGGHRQPAPRWPGLRRPAGRALGRPEAPRVWAHLPAGPQRALLNPAVSPEGEEDRAPAGQGNASLRRAAAWEEQWFAEQTSGFE